MNERYIEMVEAGILVHDVEVPARETFPCAESPRLGDHVGCDACAGTGQARCDDCGLAPAEVTVHWKRSGDQARRYGVDAVDQLCHACARKEAAAA